jgi:SNF2 family DNA or RNA helicase
MQQIILKKEPNLDSKLEAFPYQSEAVQSICELEYAAIFHEQGLGKSKIAIDLMLYWLEKKMVDTVLFVAKKNLVRNWEKEFLSHTFMKPKLLTQNKKANYYIFNSPSRLILCHYEMILSEYERFRLFLRSRNVSVILDESAKIKNPDSGIAKAFFKLAPLFHKRVIMTGTPVANRPYDIWAQIFFLDQGNSLGNDFNSFKRNADLSNNLSDHIELQDNFEHFIENIFEHISTFTVRETKRSGIIELPEKEIRKIKTDWERDQYDLYRQISEETKAIVIQEGIPSEDNADQLLKRLLRLVQVASNPALINEGYKNEPGKLQSLQNIIYDIISNNEKCIIWSAFTKNVDWLTSEFKKYGACKIHGKMNIEQRNKSVESFLIKDTVRVLVATPGSAKEGLTLTSANHVIFYDRTFSLDDYLQAQDRIHRISQKKKCFIYNLIMKDSIDEWVDELIEGKHLAAQLTQGDISLNYYKTKMSYDFGTIIKNILNIS